MPNRTGRSSRPVTTGTPRNGSSIPFDWSAMQQWSPWQTARQAETLRESAADMAMPEPSRQYRPEISTPEARAAFDVLSPDQRNRILAMDSQLCGLWASAQTIRHNGDPALADIMEEDAFRRFEESIRRLSEAPTQVDSSIRESFLQVPQSEDSEAFTMGEEETTYALQAETEQEEMGFASPEPLVPSDPLVPHESDSTAIRHFRQQVLDGDTGLMGVLSTLADAARREWREGRHPRQLPPMEVSVNTQRRAGRSRSAEFGSAFGSSTPRSRAPEQTFFGNIPETSTMTTVASTFGMRVNYPSIEKHPLIVGTHLAGVEIELENLAIEHPSFRYWTAKSDGSLRNNGMEFVCSHPWGGVDLYNAAVEIDGFLFGNNPDDTWRCSTHVHVDVRDMTAAQVKKMILAYVFFERVLFKCSGWHRYKNNFCVALGFAQGQLEDLGNWWAENDGTFLNNLASRWDKYTAINFVPMGSFGSIEFRISEAKWHKGQLIRLTNRFLSLKEVAMANSELSDEQFVDMLANTDPADIIKKGIPKGLNNLGEDLEVGFKLCHDILSLAKLRRRNRRMFRPNLEDGSRTITQPRNEFFSNGWNHCVAHLQTRYPNLDFPDTRSLRDENGNYTWTFAWLYELRTMMRRHRWTFETEWFMPQQNRSQLMSLFDRYVRERMSAEAEDAPEEAPQPRRRAEPAPSPFDDPEEDHDDEDSSEW